MKLGRNCEKWRNEIMSMQEREFELLDVPFQGSISVTLRHPPAV
jgi:hypothetical protein